MVTGRRLSRATCSAGLVGLVLVVTLGQPALAKCCQLDHLTVEGPGLGDGITLTSSELQERLSEDEFGLLYWPLFNNPFKGDERPPGKLGRAYQITYFLPNSDGELVVTADETVYPFADPPVAFAAKGQRQDFDATDGRDYRIVWGWRPFRSAAVRAIFADHSESLPRRAQGALARIPVETQDDSAFLLPLIFAGFGVTAVTVVLLGLFGRTRARPPA